MYFGELKDHGSDYIAGHEKGVSRAYCEARESICKYMYKKNKKKLSMYEICSVLRISENEFSSYCIHFGCASGYEFPDVSEDDT